MTSGRDAEIARRLHESYEAFNRGDFEGATAFAHPDVEYIPVAPQPPIRGVEQLRAWMEPSAFERMVLEAREITVFEDKVLVLIHTTARGAASGIEMEVDSWNVLTFDDDLRVRHIRTYFEHEEQEARRAAAVADPGSSG
jgi:ketosteroid isomerase-like protein